MYNSKNISDRKMFWYAYFRLSTKMKNKKIPTGKDFLGNSSNEIKPALELKENDIDTFSNNNILAK